MSAIALRDTSAVSYFLVQDQRAITLDSRRNQVYAEALAKVITPKRIVLD